MRAKPAPGLPHIMRIEWSQALICRTRISTWPPARPPARPPALAVPRTGPTLAQSTVQDLVAGARQGETRLPKTKAHVDPGARKALAPRPTPGAAQCQAHQILGAQLGTVSKT